MTERQDVYSFPRFSLFLFYLSCQSSRSTLRRRRRSSSRGSSSSRSRSRSHSRSSTTASAIASLGGEAGGRLHPLNDALIGREDVARLVAASQERGGVDAVLPGGASRRLLASPSLGGAALSAAEAEDEDAADFERMMEEELDQVVVKHVEEQKKRWEADKKARGAAEAEAEMEVDEEDGGAKKSDIPGAQNTSALQPSVAQQFYDDIYFDTDEEEDEDDDQDAAGAPAPRSVAPLSDSTTPMDRIQRTVQENEQLEKKKNKAEKKKKKHPVLTNDELFYDPDMDDEDQKWVDDKRRKNFFPAKKENRGTTSKEEEARMSRKRKPG